MEVAEKSGRGVGRDVYLADGIEQICLLDPTCRAKLGEQCFHGRELREQFEDDFAHGFEDGVVEDAGLVVADAPIAVAVVRQFVLDALAHFAEGVVFVVVAQAVGLVNEDFEVDAWVVFGEKDCCSQELADAGEVFVLAVDDPDDCANAGEYGGVIEVRS